MIWTFIKNWIKKNYKKVLVALFALALIVLLMTVAKSAKPKVWIIGPSEKVTVKVK